MPVRLPKIGESPHHIAKIQAGADVNVLDHIWVVVKDKKLIVRDSPVKQQSTQDQQRA
jgi:hypothetical protein